MFTVEPDEIEHFTGEQLVALLRRLLYAEAFPIDIKRRRRSPEFWQAQIARRQVDQTRST